MCIYIYIIFYLYVYLLLPVLGLGCCTGSSLVAASGGSSPVAVRGLLVGGGLSRGRAQA